MEAAIPALVSQFGLQERWGGKVWSRKKTPGIEPTWRGLPVGKGNRLISGHTRKLNGRVATAEAEQGAWEAEWDALEAELDALDAEMRSLGYE